MADRQARGSSQSSAGSPFKTCLAQCNRRQCAVLCSSRATVATGECSIAIITPNSLPIMHDVLLVVDMTTRSSIMPTTGGYYFINTTVGSNRCPQLPIAGAACWRRISQETPFRQCWRCDNAGNVLCRLHRPCGAHAAGGRSGYSFQLWLMQGGLGKERTLAGKSGPTCASSCRRGSLAARRVYSM
jgi:hypothetical protein